MGLCSLGNVLGKVSIVWTSFLLEPDLQWTQDVACNTMSNRLPYIPAWKYRHKKDFCPHLKNTRDWAWSV